MNPIQIPSEGGKQVNVLGIPMVIRIHGRNTDGAVAVVESHDVPDGGPLSSVLWPPSSALGLRGVLRGDQCAESSATAGHPARNGDREQIWAGILPPPRA
jgi:hypothetical protein